MSDKNLDQFIGAGKDLIDPQQSMSVADIFFANVFNQLKELVEDINKQGYLVGLEAADPKTYAIENGDGYGLMVSGKFTLTKPDNVVDFPFHIRTHYKDGHSAILILSILHVSYIYQADDRQTWKQPATLLDKEAFVPTFMRMIANEAQRPDPSIATRFKGFKLIPYIEGNAPKP